MSRRKRFAAAFVTILPGLWGGVPPAPAAGQSPAGLEIPHERWVLDNGLTVIVHEDHKAPIVAVNVWYHVGSGTETRGSTGIAHLVEHLMFNGSQHHAGDYFTALEAVGATELNGTTDRDRTNFFQTVPASALDFVLWMESDRMGWLAGAVDQEALDEQLRVVRAERDEALNQPYGGALDHLYRHAYSQEHPYSRPVSGTPDDLDDLTPDAIRDWLHRYYGAANAVLVVAGDVDPAGLREKIERYFGGLPSGPGVGRNERWVAKRTESRRISIREPVSQTRVYRAWNVPEWGSDEAALLGLAADILGEGPGSRLHERLVVSDGLATDVDARVLEGELGSVFLVEAGVAAEVPAALLERTLEDELGRFLDTGPDAREVALVRTAYRSGLVRALERVGGYGGKSDLLAEGQVFAGDAGAFRTRLARVDSATPEAIRSVAAAWLSNGDLTLLVEPHRERPRADAEVDRTAPPDPGPIDDPYFPEVRTARLSNGLTVSVVRREAAPVVELRLVVDAGYSADAPETEGLADLTVDLLDEGTTRRSRQDVAGTLRELGATLRAGSGLDESVVSLSALREHLESSLDLFAEVVLEPRFDHRDVARLKEERLAAAEAESADPIGSVLRALPRLLYPPEHAYATPFTGTGSPAALESLGREDVVDFHRDWFRPGNATLLVVGDTSMDEILPAIEARFGAWSPGPSPAKQVASVGTGQAGGVFVIDRPGAPQSVVVGASLAPPRSNPDEAAIDLIARVLGGQFGSRLNLNLREDKGWSYGVESQVLAARNERPFVILAPVETERTADAIREIRGELRSLLGDRPIDAEEIREAVQGTLLSLPGAFETNAAVLGLLTETTVNGLSWDDVRALPERLRALEPAAVRRVAGRIVRPDEMIWLVVGDLGAIRGSLEELQVGPVRHIDAEGRTIVPAVRAGGPG